VRVDQPAEGAPFLAPAGGWSGTFAMYQPYRDMSRANHPMLACEATARRLPAVGPHGIAEFVDTDRTGVSSATGCPSGTGTLSAAT
jgi:hypothetical protein